MSTIKVDTIQNTSGVQQYLAKAWVNFDGTTNGVRASGNVSSITDNGTGNFSVSFSSAMPDANYAANTMGGDSTGTGFVYAGFSFTDSSRVSTSAFSFYNVNPGEAARDSTIFSVLITR